jgi:hypothetical protein
MGFHQKLILCKAGILTGQYGQKSTQQTNVTNPSHFEYLSALH